MKKILIIGGAVLVIVIGVALFAVFSHSNTPAQTGGTTLPGAGNVNGNNPQGYTQGGNTSTSTQTGGVQTMTVAARGGGTPITTKDFIHNGTTGADPQNAGRYYLAGSAGYCLANGNCPGGASSTEFNIVYDAQNQFFNISLNSEPLGQARTDAQLFLLSTLGISQSELCRVNYYIGTQVAVNSFYAGKNLGFSFCPDATSLPK